jgi:hypothetical protein
MEPRRAILQVLWGREAGRKVVLDPGGIARVGRLPPADLVVSHDAKMSAEHFSVSWDGARGTLRDLGSLAGTFTGAEPVTECAIGHASWIRAGETMFLLAIEGATVHRKKKPDPPELVARREEARAALAAEAAPLFAVLDAARDLRVLELLRESVEEHRSLYEGARGDALADVAPYLVPLPAGALRDRFLDEGWGRSWGVVVASRAPAEQLRRQLRRLLMVDVERAGQRDARAYFRFYDPRVLRAFVPETTARQRSELFADVEAFLVEGERGEPVRLSPDLRNR